MIDVSSGRTLAEQRPEWIDTPVWPGSIAKIATLTGALDAGILTADTRIVCTRNLRLADGRSVDCSHPAIDHPLSVVEALAFSCNVFTANIARAMTLEVLTRGFVRVGFPPPPAPAAPGGGDVDRVAIALGLAGHKVAPRALLGVMRRVASEPSSASPSSSSASLRLVREGLRASAEVGTASAFSQAGIEALAKTGTALMPNGKPLGLVIAAWPADAPREALVLAFPGEGGAHAAELAARLVKRRMQPSTMSTSAGAVVRIGIPSASGDGPGYRVETMPLEDYVGRVVAGESSDTTPDAVREALAVTARTFALANRDRHHEDGFDLCTLTHCQVTRPSTAGSGRAALRTRGRVLVTADGRPAHVFYSASCGGQLQDASAVLPDAARGSVPWMRERPDPAGVAEPEWQTEIRADDLLRALRQSGVRGDHLRALSIERASKSNGLVTRVLLDGLSPSSISGDDFRRLVGRGLGWEKLKSLRFTVTRTGRGYRFEGQGHGHGVGLCVLGASALASRGYSREQLLEAYFPGLREAEAEAEAEAGAGSGAGARAGIRARTEAETKAAAATAPAPALAPALAPAPARTPLPDAAPAFLLKLPTEDEELRAQVTPAIRSALKQLQSALAIDGPAPALTIVFHPTGESYRRATGRPWWTSAATVFERDKRDNRDKATIHLVPLRALITNARLNGALRHELVHVLAGPTLRGRPLWVQEGLAEYFANERGAASVPAAREPAAGEACPDDRAFRQSTERSATERAYRIAAACVARDLAKGIPWRALGAP